MSASRGFKRLAAHIVALAASSSGWTIRRRRARRELGRRLFVLEYHSVTENRQEPEGEVHRVRFARHVDWLRQRFSLTTVSQGLKELHDQTDRGDLLALTFDDGYLNNFRIAWPVLRQAKTTATFFLTSGFLDGSALWFEVALRALREARADSLKNDLKSHSQLDELFGLGWQSRGDHETIERMKRLPGPELQRTVDRLMELWLEHGWQAEPASAAMAWQDARSLADQGAELGAHTVTHPILASAGEARQRSEIEGSKARIEAELGQPCEVFAYPNGSRRDFDEVTVRLVRAAGFAAACTTIRGSNGVDTDPMALRRIGIGRDPIYLLDARLAGLFDDGLRRRISGSHR